MNSISHENRGDDRVTTTVSRQLYHDQDATTIVLLNAQGRSVYEGTNRPSQTMFVDL